MSHSPEPWRHVWKHDTHKVKRDRTGHMLGPVTMDLDDYDRALDCVNALAGIADPAAALKGIQNALVEIKEACWHLRYTMDAYPPEFHQRRILALADAALKSIENVQEPALSSE
jgi:hypothetical protein